MSDSDLQIQFGAYTLHVGFKVQFAGNAYFNHRANPNEEYVQLCDYISGELHKSYHDQNGKGKRVWGKLNEVDIQKLKLLGDSYSSKISKKHSLKLTKPEVLAEEIIHPEEYIEGSTKKISINVFERNSKARNKCIEHYGINCAICNFNFEEVFGDIGKGYIHVHHLKPLSEIGESYNLDPVEDLRPVCPNCHAMLHRTVPAISIEALIKLKKPNNKLTIR